MNFAAAVPGQRRAKVASGRVSPALAAGDTYTAIALDLLQITDQFELMRRALIHAVNMTEQARGEPLDLAFALMRASARRIQEVAIRAELRLRDDDFDSATLAYGEKQ
jgi:hypothetical protein